MNVMAILLFFKCLTRATLVSDRPEARQNDEELVDRRLDEIGTQANVPETQVPSLETVEWHELHASYISNRAGSSSLPLPKCRYFGIEGVQRSATGFHSRARRCASAIWSDVIRLAATSRFFFAGSLPCSAARSNHIQA